MQGLIERRFGLLMAMGVLASSSSAHAQGWLADRDRAEGRGVRVGDLELHPGIGAELGYDSNVFYEDQDPDPSVILRVTPHLLLSTLGPERRGEGEERGSPPRIAFRGGVSASYYHYFLDKAKDNVEGDLSLQLTINPERPFSVFLFEQFTRTIRPFAEAEDSSDGTTFARDQNQIGVRFQLATVGNVLQARLGYMFGVDYFEDSEFAFARSLTHTIEAGSNFRFLPQTGIVYDARLDIQTYPNADSASATSNVADNVRLQTRAGLNGALTTRLSLMGLIGYMAGFYEEREEFDSVIGVLEARWQASETARFTIGYDRTFFPSFVGNFYRRDRGYANLQLTVAGSFLLGIEGSAGYLDYGIPVDPMGAPLGSSGAGDNTRADVRLTGSLFAEYRATDWFGVNATLRYTSNITDYEYMFTDMAGAMVIDPARYNKFEAFLGVRVFY